MQDGLKNGAIAKEIGINEKTVSTYVFRIKKKLQLKNEANSYLVVKTYLKEVYSF
jgi:DNA-binding NarL/FixJ family response regulator